MGLVQFAAINFGIGIVGWIIVGFILGFFFDGQTGLILSIVVAFIGALILTWIVRAVTKGNSPI